MARKAAKTAHKKPFTHIVSRSTGITAGGLLSEHTSYALAEKAVARYVAMSNGRLSAKDFVILPWPWKPEYQQAFTEPEPEQPPIKNPKKRPKISRQKQQHAELKAAVKLLRQHVKGYEAAKGYKLDKLDKLEYHKRQRAIKRAAKLKEVLAQPHDIKVAKTRKARRALLQFTRQNIRNAKHFIVHKPTPKHSVSLEDGRITVKGSFRGGVRTETKYFLFAKKPRNLRDLERFTKRLLDEMPNGFYVLQTSAHGDTGEPFERGKALARLREYFFAYQTDDRGIPTGFVDALIGFRFMSTTLKGASAQRQQTSQRRLNQREYNRTHRSANYDSSVKPRRTVAKKRRKPRKGK